ncbi:hypothetical protein BGZ76_008580 [Entomortierella beljakovae]|nr:hypothetical protein BGZ76_008580 [Entomortierella beljakovae]
MMTFREYLIFDEHNHSTFERSYKCYRSYFERQRGQGVEQLQQNLLDQGHCRNEYMTILAQKLTNNACLSASSILNAAMRKISDDVIKELSLSDGSKVDHNSAIDGKSQDGVIETLVDLTSPTSRKRQKDDYAEDL